MNVSPIASLSASQDGSHSKYVGPAEFVRIMRRHRLLVFLTLFIVIATTAAVLWSLTPRYSAVAAAIVEAPDTADEDPAKAVTAAREQEIKIANVMQFLQSRPLARLVVADLALHDSAEFNPNADSGQRAVAKKGWLSNLSSNEDKDSPKQTATRKSKKAKNASPLPPKPEDVETATDYLLNHLQVTQSNKSNVISVAFSSEDPDKAARVANKIVSRFISLQVADRQAANQATIVSLDKRVNELRGQLIAADAKVAAYRKANGLSSSPTDLTQLDRLAGELSTARTTRAANEARLAAAATGSPSVIGSPVLADLQTQEITLQRKIAELSSLFGDGHPDMQNTKAQLASVQRRIAEETARASASLSAQAASSRALESQISGDIGALRAQTFQQGIASVGLMDLQRDADTSRTLYVSLLSRLKDLSRQDKPMKADAEFVSRATPPPAPTYPAKKKIMIAAVVAALMLATILAFVAESWDGRIRTSEQVERITDTQALAMVPEISRRWQGMPAYVGVLERPCSAFSEAIRSLQMELSARMRDRAVQIVVITSPLPGEGKTTIAMSLAAAGASTGSSSVVVDLDLRRPGLQNDAPHAAIGLGVIEFLSDEASIDEVLRTDDRVPNLSMIGVRQPAKDPGAILASPRLPVLIGELAKRFKLIVLNAPPILPVRDAKILASFADEVLMIVRWNKTPPDALRAAVKMLPRLITGAVLNRVDYKRHAGLVYGDAIQHYSKYSVYYGDDDAGESDWISGEAHPKTQMALLGEGRLKCPIEPTDPSWCRLSRRGARLTRQRVRGSHPTAGGRAVLIMWPISFRPDPAALPAQSNQTVASSKSGSISSSSIRSR